MLTQQVAIPMGNLKTHAANREAWQSDAGHGQVAELEEKS